MTNLHADMHGQTPEMKFSKIISLSTRLSHFNTFGCLVYILDETPQSVGGGSPPKWDPRACLWIYLCHYPSHAGSVALVMNPMTGLVSLQLHLVFDDNFETVPLLCARTVPEIWADLVTNSRENSTEGFYDIKNMALWRGRHTCWLSCYVNPIGFHAANISCHAATHGCHASTRC